MGETLTLIILAVIGLPMFIVATQSEKFVEWVNRFHQ